MTKITNQHKATMGETGAGIIKEEEIDMSQENVFYHKVGYIPCSPTKTSMLILHQQGSYSSLVLGSLRCKHSLVST